MSAIDAWKATDRAMAAQGLTLHNLGGDIWEVADQMLAAIAEMDAENERAWGERDHYLKKLQERNTQLQQAEAVASSSDTLLGEATGWAKDARERADKAEAESEGLRSRRLPCAEAEVAQRRYEDAEAGRDRFSAILDLGLTIMNDKQDIVGTLALRDAAMAYDADIRARAEEGSGT